MHALPQRSCPGVQPLATHWPEVHEAPPSHAFEQVPQCRESADRLAQVPSQSVLPVAQTQRPWLQIFPPAQTTPTQAASTQVPW